MLSIPIPDAPVAFPGNRDLPARAANRFKPVQVAKNRRSKHGRLSEGQGSGLGATGKSVFLLIVLGQLYFEGS